MQGLGQNPAACVSCGSVPLLGPPKMPTLQKANKLTQVPKGPPADAELLRRIPSVAITLSRLSIPGSSPNSGALGRRAWGLGVWGFGALGFCLQNVVGVFGRDVFRIFGPPLPNLPHGSRDFFNLFPEAELNRLKLRGASKLRV